MSNVKDLPKIGDNLKGELLAPHKLKETQVKTILNFINIMDNYLKYK